MSRKPASIGFLLHRALFFVPFCPLLSDDMLAAIPSVFLWIIVLFGPGGTARRQPDDPDSEESWLESVSRARCASRCLSLHSDGALSTRTLQVKQDTHTHTPAAPRKVNSAFLTLKKKINSQNHILIHPFFPSSCFSNVLNNFGYFKRIFGLLSLLSRFFCLSSIY